MRLSERAERFLAEAVGVGAPSNTRRKRDLEVAPSRLSDAQFDALAGIVGDYNVDRQDRGRIEHATGCSLTDYLELRAGGVVATPDAVVSPGGHEQVVGLLRACVDHGIDVVPFGGGTSVVGGVDQIPDARRPAIALTFNRMASVVGVDQISGTVTVQPGITGPTLERILGARGLTLGHFPQSWERASMGGYVATRSAGQASSGYGRSDEMVEALRIATPTLDVRFGRAPMSAAGPDLRQLFIGSEGAFGVITEITLRVRRTPEHTRYEGLMFPDYRTGISAFRELSQLGLKPDVMRLSDEHETATSLAMSAPGGLAGDLLGRYLDLRKVSGGCMAILGWESHSRRLLTARRAAARDVLRRFGAATLGGSVGSSWRKHRFEGPYLRDELLDRGYIVETLETATHWRGLPALQEAIATALRRSLATDDANPYVMSHVSHVYDTGASLYLTVIAVADSDPIAQWAAAKRAATDAIMANDGTVTHHHSVGRDHSPWLVGEIGAGGVHILRAVKDLVDPSGVMNPGKLLPIA